MNDKHFVDTSILMYAHDTTAGLKHHRAKALVEELWRNGTGVISTQVLEELCIHFRRRTERRPDWKIVREIVKDYMSWEVIVNTGQSVLEALEIERRRGISFWDALIVQAAERSGAAVLYSEDFSNGQVYSLIRVVNPFTEPQK
jgi:predicted nucleic acid-binding protein